MTQQQIPIKGSDADLKGSYSNFVQVAQAKEEFMLDFFVLAPPAGILLSRVFLSPGHAKRLARVLQDSVKKYEDQFGGSIEAAKEPEGGIGFKTE